MWSVSPVLLAIAVSCQTTTDQARDRLDHPLGLGQEDSLASSIARLDNLPQLEELLRQGAGGAEELLRQGAGGAEELVRRGVEASHVVPWLEQGGLGLLGLVGAAGTVLPPLYSAYYG